MSNMMVLCLRVAILAILACELEAGGGGGARGGWGGGGGCAGGGALGSPACFDQWYECVVEGVS
jgi:hypothetical protein